MASYLTFNFMDRQSNLDMYFNSKGNYIWDDPTDVRFRILKPGNYTPMYVEVPNGVTTFDMSSAENFDGELILPNTVQSYSLADAKSFSHPFVSPPNVFNLDSKFLNMHNIPKISIETNKITSLYGTFANCYNLKEVSFQKLYYNEALAQPTLYGMGLLFYDCYSLQKVNLQLNYDYSDSSFPYATYYMFYNCRNLKELHKNFIKINKQYENGPFSMYNSMTFDWMFAFCKNLSINFRDIFPMSEIHHVYNGTGSTTHDFSFPMVFYGIDRLNYDSTFLGFFSEDPNCSLDYFNSRWLFGEINTINVGFYKNYGTYQEYIRHINMSFPRANWINIGSLFYNSNIYFYQPKEASFNAIDTPDIVLTHESSTGFAEYSSRINYICANWLFEDSNIFIDAKNIKYYYNYNDGTFMPKIRYNYNTKNFDIENGYSKEYGFNFMFGRYNYFGYQPVDEGSFAIDACYVFLNTKFEFISDMKYENMNFLIKNEAIKRYGGKNYGNIVTNTVDSVNINIMFENFYDQNVTWHLTGLNPYINYNYSGLFTNFKINLDNRLELVPLHVPNYYINIRGIDSNGYPTTYGFSQPNYDVSSLYKQYKNVGLNVYLPISSYQNLTDLLDYSIMANSVNKIMSFDDFLLYNTTLLLLSHNMPSAYNRFSMENTYELFDVIFSNFRDNIYNKEKAHKIPYLNIFAPYSSDVIPFNYRINDRLDMHSFHDGNNGIILAATVSTFTKGLYNTGFPSNHFAKSLARIIIASYNWSIYNIINRVDSYWRTANNLYWINSEFPAYPINIKEDV